MSVEHTSVGEYHQRRISNNVNEIVFDANFFLRASQLHRRPKRPGVAELIETEIRYGTDLISHLHDAYLVVGDEPIKGVQLSSGTLSEITIEPRTELAIDQVLDEEEPNRERVVVLHSSNQLFHILPSVLASTLAQGGVIHGQVKSQH